MLLHVGLDRSVLDDDELAPIGRRFSFGLFNKFAQSLADAIAAFGDERPHDHTAFTVGCETRDQMLGQFPKDVIGECIEQEQRGVDIAFHADAFQSGLTRRSVDLDAAEITNATR